MGSREPQTKVRQLQNPASFPPCFTASVLGHFLLVEYALSSACTWFIGFGFNHLLQTSWKEFLPLYSFLGTKTFPSSLIMKLKKEAAVGRWTCHPSHLYPFSTLIWKLMSSTIMDFKCNNRHIEEIFNEECAYCTLKAYPRSFPLKIRQGRI